VALRLRPKPELAQLDEQLSQALREQEQADEALGAAEAARDALDGLDPDAWRQAEARMALARSEAERLGRVVDGLRAKAADEADRIAREELGRVEAEAAKIDAAIGEHEAALAGLREKREKIDERLDDAHEAVAEARLGYVAPDSDEARRHAERQRQQRELLTWAARQAGREEQVPRRLRPAVHARREQLNREAQAAHEAAVAKARESGQLVEAVDHGIERLDVA
jgi:hypothetical protein